MSSLCLFFGTLNNNAQLQVHEGQAQIYQILQQMEIKLTAIQQNSGSVPQTSGQAAVAGPGG